MLFKAIWNQYTRYIDFFLLKKWMTRYLSYRSLRKSAPCLFSHVKRMIFNQFAYREPFANVTNRYICMLPQTVSFQLGEHTENNNNKKGNKLTKATSTSRGNNSFCAIIDRWILFPAFYPSLFLFLSTSFSLCLPPSLSLPLFYYLARTG